MYNQMFRKYLLKNEFWQTRGGETGCFIKHDPVCGGIYAKLLQRGVEIRYNNESQVFTNFDQLDDFLNRISVRNNFADDQQFMSLINRKMTSKWLRSSLPL